MGGSFGQPDKEPSGRITHPASGSTVTIYWTNGGMYHKLEEDGLTADYRISNYVGFGKIGRSYLIQQGGYLFQSPASYYVSKGWDVSPGYERSKILDFTRGVASDCLFCHADARAAGISSRKVSQEDLGPLTCDRCHGNSEAHLKNPVPGSILNPAKMQGRLRDSVCEQCHVEGAASILNPGKQWSDFHPGERLEDVATDYVFQTEASSGTSIAAVSQAQQLSLSACKRASGDRIWCGTCHDPHGPAITDRKRQIRNVCESCHAATQLSKTHEASQTDCIACHMPTRQAADIAHAAVTDHRIIRRADTAADAASQPKIVGVVPWHDALPQFAQRNLALAYFNAAKQRNSGEFFQHAYDLLSQLPSAEQDAPVQAALGYLLLGSGHANLAIPYFDRAAKADPQSAEYSLDLGVAQQAAGNFVAAIAAFRDSMSKDPYDYRPYRALADLYTRTGNPGQSAATVAQFLTLVPESISMRVRR